MNAQSVADSVFGEDQTFGPCRQCWFVLAAWSYQNGSVSRKSTSLLMHCAFIVLYKEAMKILVWASSYGHTIGGGPVLGPLLFGALAARGHEVLVLTDHRPRTLPGEEDLAGVRVRRFPFREALGGDGRLFVTLRQQVSQLRKNFDPDLIHIFSPGYSELFHHLTETTPKSPLVVTLHDSFPARSFHPEAIIGRDVRAASWITACSQFVLRNARRHVPGIADRSSAILNALPPPDVTPWAPLSGRPELLYVGRLVEKKGVDLLLRAIDRLGGMTPAPTLTIIGKGDDEEGLKKLSEDLGIASRVTFAGSLDRKAVLERMSACSMVVVPSRIEPFGLVALEAAQVGCPVVASRVDGLPEVIADRQTGLLVPPDDVNALAASIMSIIGSPAEARRLGQQARDRALNSFSWDAYVSAFDALFRKLACL